MEPLGTNNNIDNEYQYCKGCERNLPLNMFIISKNHTKLVLHVAFKANKLINDVNSK